MIVPTVELQPTGTELTPGNDAYVANLAGMNDHALSDTTSHLAENWAKVPHTVRCHPKSTETEATVALDVHYNSVRIKIDAAAKDGFDDGIEPDLANPPTPTTFDKISNNQGMGQ